ncbi:T9SS type A sorting domain-containing protein [Flavobacterium sp.]|uniref:T9SS type A sorting domain-containing protein n=1 Tax=Flavobacterium sp. TaxID=239 RepID=UPI003C64B3AB
MKRLSLKSTAFFVLITCNLITVQAQNYPASDPNNTQGWIANNDLSDEFNAATLDKTKWWILGENGDYRSKWKGRAPGQFIPQNVKIENGELVLSSKWEPNFTFINESFDGVPYGGTNKSSPITQSCIMSERFFRYGYMEIRSKAANAPVTSAFWTTGYQSEIDMTENYGKVPKVNTKNTNASLEKKYRTNVINWDPAKAANYYEWKNEYDLPIRVASDYIVYGFEWDKDYMKMYYNGVLFKTVTRQTLEANDIWRHDFPQEIWLDAEVFSWYGLPAAADLASAAEYNIDYVRIWQKEIKGPYFNALGFEGPFYSQGRSTNWWAAGSMPSWNMNGEKVASGDFSLRFKNTALPTTFDYSIYAPAGSLNLPAGANEIKMKIWIDPNTTLNNITVTLANPWIKIIVPVSNAKKGQWVEISKTFTRSNASVLNNTNGDRVQLQVQNTDIVGSNALFYIDDISFKNTILSVKNEEKKSFKIYPNPAKENVTIVSPDNGKIKIHNTLGTIVKTVEKTIESQIIAVSDLAKGIYFMTLTTNGITTKSQKLIIE